MHTKYTGAILASLSSAVLFLKFILRRVAGFIRRGTVRRRTDRIRTRRLLRQNAFGVRRALPINGEPFVIN